ncbi:hypothetical protein FBQ85_06255 [Cytophagia bacterium CHB2]|nr:hypothetical protein [Cytophagia bacterium CHB2]
MQQTTRDLGAIFIFGLVLRLALLLAFPAPFGNDAFGRLYFRDTLFLAHWLPLAQAFVFFPALLTDKIVFIRLLFAVPASLSACGFYLFLRLLVARPFAVIGGLLFAVNALYVILSLMPYQDVLFLGLFYAALALLLRDEPKLQSKTGMMLYGLACLTRYESWFVLPLLVLWKTKIAAAGLTLAKVSKSFLKAAIFFGWAPLLWLLLSQLHWGNWNSFMHQTPDREFYAWHPHVDLMWAAQYAGRMLYWLVLFGSPLLLFALPGIRRFWQNRKALLPVLKLPLLACAVTLAFFFFIIGKEYGTVNRFAMFPMSLALIFAVLGMEMAYQSFSTRPGWRRKILQPRVSDVLAISVLAGLVIYAAIPVSRLHANPEFRDPYEITQYLDRVLQKDEKALVVAPHEQRWQGATPMAYQRIVAQSMHHRERILSAGLLQQTERSALLQFAKENHVKYLVIFDNFSPWHPADVVFSEYAKMNRHQLKLVLQARAATIHEVPAWQE